MLENSNYVITVAHAIQQSVAPVFLLTGVGSILGVISGRLSRIIDRTRVINAMDDKVRQKFNTELMVLTRRTTWVHSAIILCTFSALFVCIVIGAIFIGSELDKDPSSTISVLFIFAMATLIAGLLCFLREIALATGNYHQ
jgi:predicted MFS family arabinose efflux permease